MPYKVDLSPDRKLNCWWLTGHIVTSDILSSMTEMAAHPDFLPHRNTIVFIDKQADLSSFDLAEFRNALAQVKRQNQSIRGEVNIRCAILSGSIADQGILGLWEALSTMGEATGVEFRVFMHEKTAMNWLLD